MNNSKRAISPWNVQGYYDVIYAEISDLGAEVEYIALVKSYSTVLHLSISLSVLNPYSACRTAAPIISDKRRFIKDEA